MDTAALLILALLILLIWEFVRRRSPQWSFVVPEVPYGKSKPSMEKIFSHINSVDTRHAPAFVERHGKLHLVWFDGSREAAPDVKVRGVDLETGEISDWFGPKDLGAKMRPREFIRFVGNTIGLSNDRFLATFVSIGGWAGSSLALCSFDDQGRFQARRLVSNPYANRSHLVRCPAVSFTDGDQLVPAYFEARHAFSTLLRLTPTGQLIARARIGHGRQLVQTAIQVLDSKTAFSLSRCFDRSACLYRSETQDGGRTWSPPQKTDLPCPGSPVGMARLSDGRTLMVHSPEADNSKTLRLSVSDDAGHSWRVVHEFGESNDAEIKPVLRYPALHAHKDGQLYLTASVNNKMGVVVWRFNQAWVDQQEIQNAA